MALWLVLQEKARDWKESGYSLQIRNILAESVTAPMSRTTAGRGFVENNQTAGTTGELKRLEAIKIELTGDMANHYDIYYRVHAQTFGWLGWAKNGEEAGTSGYSYRLEGIQIQLVEKGGAAAGKYGRRLSSAEFTV